MKRAVRAAVTTTTTATQSRPPSFSAIPTLGCVSSSSSTARRHSTLTADVNPTTHPTAGVSDIPLKPFKSIPKAKGGLPLIGHTLELLFNLSKFHLITERFLHEGDVVWMEAGRASMVLVSRLEDVSHVMQSKHFSNRTEFDAMTYFRDVNKIGHGIAFSNGPDWERGRSIANKTLLVPKIAQGFIPAILETADVVVEKWKKLHGTDVSISPDVDAFTLDSIGNIAFGENFNALSGKHTELAQAITDLMNLSGKLLLMPFPYYKYIDTPTSKGLNHAFKVLMRIGGGILEKTRKELAAGEDEAASTGRTNYVKLLLTTKDDSGQVLSDGEILGNVVDIIAAGQESTARMLSWAIHVLSKDMELQERLRDEVRQHVKSSNDLTYDLVMGRSMPLLGNILKEVLRLYPPGPVVSRLTVADEAVGGYHIPPGTNVAVSPWALGRSPELWKDPLKFNPDRFNEDHHPFAWLAFGAGRRGCVGMRVAMLEGKILLAKLVENFTFEHNSKYRDPVPINKFTLAPDGPVMATIRHRPGPSVV